MKNKLIFTLLSQTDPQPWPWPLNLIYIYFRLTLGRGPTFMVPKPLGRSSLVWDAHPSPGPTTRRAPAAQSWLTPGGLAIQAGLLGELRRVCEKNDAKVPSRAS